MKFFPAVAYHICLNLPEKFSQPEDHFLAQPSSYPTDLTDESLHLPVESWEAPLDELRQQRDRVRGRLTTQRADRRKGVLNIYTKW